MAFYKGLADNRSVRMITLANLPFDKCGEGISTILSPFFELNNNLRSLELADFYAYENSPKFLLSINNKHIQSIDIQCYGGEDDELVTKSISALETYQSLIKLRFNMMNNKIKTKSIALIHVLDNASRASKAFTLLTIHSRTLEEELVILIFPLIWI